MPQEGEKLLENIAFDLSTKTHTLAASINPIVKQSLASIVRSMNCYYSNLIEGHYTHPRDIDRALHADYETQPEKRNLQLEARAHIEVQTLIDTLPLDTPITTTDFISWLHKEFCSRLPPELLEAKNPQTGEVIRFEPGELRKSGVQIGRHIPPTAEELPKYLERFSQAYDPSRYSKLRQIIAVAASHHRLLWIHPFYDGNGRVARLFSHAFLRSLGIADELWSVSRGLARTVQDYKRFLAEADLPRLNDYDGRGALSQKYLNAFCEYFLNVCIDQIDFMGELLDLKNFLSRLETMCEVHGHQGKMPPGSFPLLRELFFVGEIERGQAPSITGYKERQARSALSTLLKNGYLVSDTPKGPVRLNFPLDVVEFLFPNLYPAT